MGFLRLLQTGKDKSSDPRRQAIDARLPQGVGRRGKVFFLMALSECFAATALFRSVAAPQWLHGASIGVREYGLLAVAGVCSVGLQVSFLLRIHERLHRSSTIINIVFSTLKVLSIASVIASFHYTAADVLDQSNVPGDRNWDQGFCALITTSVFSSHVMIAAFKDHFLTRGENDDVGRARRRVIQANVMIVWLLVFGAIGFRFIERRTELSLIEAYNFSIVTVLTIGYGNSIVATTGGRLFLFGFFIVGVSCIGYFVSSVEDYIIEKAKVNLARIYMLRCLNEAEKKRRKEAGSKEKLQKTKVIEQGELMRRRIMMALFPDRVDPAIAAEVEEADEEADDEKKKKRKEKERERGVDDREGERQRGNRWIPRFFTGFNMRQTPSPDVESTTVVNESTSSSADSTSETCSVTAAMEHDETFQTKLQFYSLVRMIVISLTWWFVSAYIFHALEPTWSYMDGLYFTFCTITTIGYGDLYPSRPASWEFWNVFVLSGVAGAAYAVGLLTERFTSRFARSAAKAQLRIEKRRVRKLAEAEAAAKNGGNGTGKSPKKRRSRLHLLLRSSTSKTDGDAATDSSSASPISDNGGRTSADPIGGSSSNTVINGSDHSLDDSGGGGDDEAAIEDSADGGIDWRDTGVSMEGLIEQVYEVIKTKQELSSSSAPTS